MKTSSVALTLILILSVFCPLMQIQQADQGGCKNHCQPHKQLVVRTCCDQTMVPVAMFHAPTDSGSAMAATADLETGPSTVSLQLPRVIAHSPPGAATPDLFTLRI